MEGDIFGIVVCIWCTRVGEIKGGNLEGIRVLLVLVLWIKWLVILLSRLLEVLRRDEVIGLREEVEVIIHIWHCANPGALLFK